MVGFDILSFISCGRCGGKICRIVRNCRATSGSIIVRVCCCRGVLNDDFLTELLGAVVDEIVPLLEAVMVQDAAHVAHVGALVGILPAVL